METKQDNTQTVEFTEAQYTAYNALRSLAPSFTEAAQLAADAEATRDGAHDMAVDSAILCGSWQAWEPVIVRLEDAIRNNTDGEAEAWQAKPGKTEGRYIVPNTVSHIKSRIKKAFELEIPFIDENGIPRSFNAIKADVKNTQDVLRDAEKAEARDKAMAEFADVRAYGASLVTRLADLVRELPEAQLAELCVAMESTLGKFEPSAETEADESETSAESSASELAKVA